MKKNFYLALLGICIGGIGFGLITPVTVVLLEKSNTPAWVTGSVTMLGYVSIVIFSFFSGRIIDQYGIRKALLAGLAIWMLGALGHIFWKNFILLAAVKFIMGIGGTFVFVTTEVIINSYSDESNRGKNIGLYVVLLSFGIAAGTLLIWTIEIGDTIPFFIGTAIMFIVLVIQFILFEDVKILSGEKPPDRMKLRQMPLISMVSSVVYGFFESSIIVAVPMFALRHNFSEEQVSYFLASFVVGGIVLLYFISMFSDKYYKYFQLLGISIVLGLLFILPMISTGFILLMLTFFLMGGVVPAYYTVGLNYTVENIEKNFVSQANGYYIMMYGLGTIAGPLFGSVLVDLNKNYGYWAFSSVLCFAFFLSFSALKTKRK